MTDCAIAFEQVGLRLGGVSIYDKLTFDVRRSEFVCLLGPSGCGKSTALRLIGDLLPVQDGAVLVEGRSPARAWERLAYVFQSPRLLPWKDALDNAAFGLEMRAPAMPVDERRARAAKELRRLGLGADAHKMPLMLSGGERQRVAIARALALEPDIILMDEPFSALDPNTRGRQRRQLIELWQGTGKTILFVTHDVDEALTLADRIIVLSPKPARVVHVRNISTARPRQIETDPGLREARGELLALFATFGIEHFPAKEWIPVRRKKMRPLRDQCNGGCDMKTWLIGGLLAAAMLTAPAQAQTAVTFGYLADPSHEAVMWAVRNGKVKSDKVKIEATPLDISALIQATAARTYDVVQTAAVAVPRARERGLDLRIVGTGLRYHASGEGAGIWVKKDSPIKSLTDLKGRKLGVYSLGSAGITLIRIALADVHGLNVAVRGGDVEFVEMPAPALPAALASARIDAATLIHAQAFKAQQSGEFVPLTQTAERPDQKIRRAHGLGGARRLRREARREAGDSTRSSCASCTPPWTTH